MKVGNRRERGQKVKLRARTFGTLGWGQWICNVFVVGGVGDRGSETP